MNPEEANKCLYTAAEESNLDNLNEAIAAGADTEYESPKDLLNWNSESPINNSKALHVACLLSSMPIVAKLLEVNAKVNVTNSWDHTPLHFASWNGNSEVALLLLDRGADLDAKTKGGETALHYVSKKGHLEVARHLLDRRADPNARSMAPANLTPLQYALRGGNSNVALLLLNSGADYNVKGLHDQTTLHYASGGGQLDAVFFLIVRGAYPDAQDALGRTPREVACTFPGTTNYQNKESCKAIQVFFERCKVLMTILMLLHLGVFHWVDMSMFDLYAYTWGQ